MVDRRSELEAAIDADPYDLANFEVLADFLLQQGDPRGELIARQVKAERESSPEVEAGPFAPRCSNRTSLIWRAGYIQQAQVALDELAQVVDHPSARFLVALEILSPAGSRLPKTPPIQPLIDHLASRPRPALRQLRMLLNGNFEFAIGPVFAIGDLARLWRAVPALEALSLFGSASSTADIDLPQLGLLELAAPQISTDLLARVRAATWPELGALAIRGNLGDSHGELCALFASPRFPKLVHFELTHAQTGLELVLPVLARSPMLRRLQRLRLSSLTDVAADVLVKHRRAFEHLEELAITGHQLTRPMLDDLRALGPHVAADPIGRRDMY